MQHNGTHSVCVTLAASIGKTPVPYGSVRLSRLAYIPKSNSQEAAPVCLTHLGMWRIFKPTDSPAVSPTRPAYTLRLHV